MTRARRWIVAVVAAGAVGLPSCTGSADHLVNDCTRRDLHGRSVARVWDEALLDAIRRDVPAPTVHARNLFHTSAAMWDAWAAYDPDADGYFVHEKLEADDVRAARETAISYAAYRILLWRYSRAAGLQETFDELADTMRSLCYRIDYVSTEGDSPAALGNRIAAAAIAYGASDGSLEDQRYVDTDYRPVNAPLVVAEPGAPMTDPNRWQPLALAQIVAQNGLPIPGNVQRFVGPHWGHVKGFALPPRGRRYPDRSRSAPAPRRGRCRVRAGGGRGDPRQQLPRPERRRADRHRPGRPRRQHPGHERRGRARSQPGDGGAVPTGHGAPRRLRARPGAVLGGRPRVGDTARALEHGRQRRVGQPRVPVPHRRDRTGGRPARVGREALLRPQRRRPRCRRRRLGSQGFVRLRPTDLDDPIHGRLGTVERSRRALPTIRRASRSCPIWWRW